MSYTERKRVLHYKHAKFFSGTSLNLQDLLDKAVANFKDVEQREQVLTTGSDTRRVLSGVGKTKGMTRGRLMQYTKGQRQQFLEKDKTTADYKLDSTAVPAGKQGAAKREFVESILYFAVFGNHMMYVGTHALGSRALEDHINWLLASAGQIKLDQDQVILADQQSVAAMEQIKSQRVSEVELGADLLQAVNHVPAKRRSKSDPGRKGYKLLEPVGSAAEALKTMVGEWFGDAPLEVGLRRNERIEVKVMVRYVSQTKTDAGFDLMEKLAVAGRHWDKDDCKIHLYKSGTLKGDDLKLESDINVKIMDDTGLVEEIALFESVHSWIEDKISRKAVSSK